MNRAQNYSSPLTRGVQMLYDLSTNLKLHEQDQELAFKLLECADRLDALVNKDYYGE